MYRRSAAICTALAIFSIASSAHGHDPVWLLLLVILMSPAILLILLATPLPQMPINWRPRSLAVASILVIISVLHSNWPFHLTFMLHQPLLEPIAESVRASGTIKRPGVAGLYRYRQIRVIPEGSVGFQLSGGAGGGAYLVQRGPENPLVWYNTNWCFDLGNNWYLVFED